MLLRVDVFPSTFSVDEASKELQSPPQSLLVSLNTSSSATVLTVGRMDTLVVFGTDKSISRQHMTLELVSSHDFEKVDGKPLPRSPQGAVESDACSEYDMICVVKDSSKCGTYLVTGDKAEGKKVDAHDSTCDDETDDEGQDHALNAPQGSRLSSVATKIVDSADATLLKITQPLALMSLCQPQGRVVIQVGLNGSTLVIHRVSIRIVLLQASKEIKDLWSSRSYLMGTTLLESVDTSITHLVTDARVAEPKSLTAWCLAKPLVTFDFLEAIWNRYRQDDPLPHWESYETPETQDGLPFWKEKPNPNLWSQTTMLSFGQKGDGLEELCRAAGSTIIELDNHDNPTIAIKEIVQANEGLFYVQSVSVSTSHAKIVKRRLRTLNIPYVTQETIMRCVSQHAPLVADSNHKVIGMQVLAIEESAAATKETRQRTPRSRKSKSHKTKPSKKANDGWLKAAGQQRSELKATESLMDVVADLVVAAKSKVTRVKQTAPGVKSVGRKGDDCGEDEIKPSKKVKSSNGIWLRVGKMPSVRTSPEEQAARDSLRPELENSFQNWIRSATGEPVSFGKAGVVSSLRTKANVIGPKPCAPQDSCQQSPKRLCNKQKENNVPTPHIPLSLTKEMDDEVCIVKVIPAMAPPPVTKDCHDEECWIVGQSKHSHNALSDYPHSREDCVVHPIILHVNAELNCPQCYCYVCDVPVTDCRHWKQHCLARHQDPFWQTKRRHKRDQADQGKPRSRAEKSTTHPFSQRMLNLPASQPLPQQTPDQCVPPQHSTRAHQSVHDRRGTRSVDAQSDEDDDYIYEFRQP